MAGLARRFGRIAAFLVMGLAAACPNPMLDLIKEKVKRAENPAAVLMANFSVDKSSGEIPLTVKFTDESTPAGQIDSWTWYFDFSGDPGITSNEQNPSHTYSVPGIYTVKLVVSGVAGLDEETKQGLISVTSKAPTVDITAPKNGDFVKGTVEILATANDDLSVEKVEFYINGVLAVTASAAPYSYSWNTSGLNGPYALKAIAYDEDSNTGTDDDTMVTVDNTAPSVDITSPLNGASVGGSSTTIMAAAADNDQVARVEFYIDGVIKHTDSDAPHTYNWDTQSSGDGSHSLKAKAYDRAGNEASDDDTVVTVDNSLPSVNVTAPLHGAHVRGLTEISASAFDTDGVAKVEFYVDGALLATDATAPYSASWDTTAAGNGVHELMARSYDAANNYAVDNDTTVTVDNTAPNVNFTAPANGAVVRGTISVTASASDNTGVTKVEFYVDGAATPIATDTSSPYSCSWDTTGYSNASHSLQAKAYDQAGNATTDNDTSVTVDNSAPTVNITAPVNGAAVRGTVSVTATASDNRGVTKVEFYVDGTATPIATDTSSPYSTTWDTTGYSNASHSLQVKAYDAAGNTTTDNDTSVTVDNSLPTVNITAPANGATVAGVVTVTATASDNRGVTKVEFSVNGSLKSTDTASPYSYSWDTRRLNDGSYSLMAKAYDEAGNYISDNDTTVSVDNISFTTQSVGADGGSIAIYGNQVYIAYRSSNRIYLAKSVDSGSTFNTAEVPIGGAYCSYSLGMVAFYDAAYSNVTVSIVYDHSGSALRYIQSTDGGTTWSTPAVIADDSPRFIRMAKTSYRIDSFTVNVLLVAYVDEDLHRLMFLSKSGGSNFTTPLVLETSDGPTNPRISAMGDWISLSYDKTLNHSLNYLQSNNRGTSWATAVQRITSWSGYYHNIYLDLDGPNICYSTASPGGILNVDFSTNHGTTWQTATVNPSSSSYYNFHAIGQGNDYRVAYVYNYTLMLASSDDRSDWYYSYEIDTGIYGSQVEMICSSNLAYIIYGGKFAKVTFNY